MSNPFVRRSRGVAETTLQPPQVSRFQQILLDQGFVDTLLFVEPTGSVSEGMRAALRRYQRSRNLPETGLLDPSTQDRLDREVGAPPPIPAATSVGAGRRINIVFANLPEGVGVMSGGNDIVNAAKADGSPATRSASETTFGYDLDPRVAQEIAVIPPAGSSAWVQIRYRIDPSAVRDNALRLEWSLAPGSTSPMVAATTPAPAGMSTGTKVLIVVGVGAVIALVAVAASRAADRGRR